MKKTLLLLTFIVLTCKIFAQLPGYVPSNGLVVWYPFSGNANDYGPNMYNGINHYAVLTSDRFGNVNNAYSFNGFSAYIDCPLVPMFTTEISISAWFYRYAPSSNYEGVVTKWTQLTANAEFWFGSIGVTTNYSYAGPSSQHQTQTTSFPLNQWNHCVITYNSSGLAKVYLNGVQISSVQYSPYLLSVTNPVSMKIGTESVGFRHWNGLIDDIGVWNRALTTTEVLGLYNACSSPVLMNPTNQQVTANQTAIFTVMAAPGFPIQWQTNIGFGWQNLFNAGQYSGVNNDTLTVSNVSQSNNNQLFRCVVSNGACSDTSTVAAIQFSATGLSNPGNAHALIAMFDQHENTINLQGNLPAEALHYVIYNLSGQRIMQGALHNSESRIDASGLPSGCYFLTTDNSTLPSWKFIKEE